MSNHNSLSRRKGPVTLAFAVVVSVACLSGPASAQGLFEFLFGRLLNPAVAPQPSTESIGSASSSSPAADLPHRTVAYCVRLCDGRYFPVQRTRETTPAQQCKALCPASPTRVFRGNGIDHAAAYDGTGYASLDNAFVYRKRVVAGCTCNGSSPFGLQAIDVEADPTLRAGDTVVTANGSMTFKGRTAGRADFAPVAGPQGRLTDIRKVLASRRLAQQ